MVMCQQSDHGTVVSLLNCVEETHSMVEMVVMRQFVVRELIEHVIASRGGSDSIER